MSCLQEKKLSFQNSKEKICKKCSNSNPIEDYFLWDGIYRGNICKRCRYDYKNKWRREKVGYFKEQYRKTDRNKLKERWQIRRDKERFGGLRNDVLERDNFKCVKCGKETKTIHHIDWNGRGKENPNNNIENLITMCQSCHMKLHMTIIWKERKANGYRTSK